MTALDLENGQGLKTLFKGLRIIEKLKRRDSAKDIARDLGVTTRMAYRILKTIKAAGIPLQKDSHNCKYFIDNA